MKNLIELILTSLILGACQTNEESNWTTLLDKDLTHWNRYLSYKHQLGYDGTVPKDETGKEIQPIGLNPEGYDVFSATEENNEPILKVSGEIYGCVITKQEYKITISAYRLNGEIRSTTRAKTC
ncbi:hypothetical protein OU798_13465 [Prolixibacteraceae bacterium Z1-6]|uniref:Uncharacterized protein n=1 Tax=Draconibacterium aestuarii TaxID=2998507 RepID=A0A9X3FET0_9BACT|nr:hypothetical protein [Prolixibacteraceae bacterium Z1-6]